MGYNKHDKKIDKLDLQDKVSLVGLVDDNLCDFLIAFVKFH